VMLGHGSTQTTQQFYARMKATRAIELFTKAVLGERDALIKKLKLVERHPVPGWLAAGVCRPCGAENRHGT
jgi:hypothetical protein